MMRTMRHISKYVFWIVAVTFIGWLAYGQVTEILSGGRDTVLKINGTTIRVAQFQAGVQAAQENYRRQNGNAPITREAQRQIDDQVVNELVQATVIRQAYERLGFTVTDQEILQEALTNPPPQVLQTPEFQTNGQFDPAKWQRFLSSGSNPEFLLQLEALYRDQIPQRKLAAYITADLYVSDAKLWRIYRDQHDSVKVALLTVRPDQVPDTAVSVSDADLQRYYTSHKNDFTRPAYAYLSFVALPRYPDAVDSAAALARARQVRAQVAGGGVAKFAEVAKKQSSDSVSGAKGGDLGWINPGNGGFDRDFLKALKQLRPGQLSQPVLTQFGYHLIRVDSARGDSVRARHILVPIELRPAHRDIVDARTDSLDRLAAERDNGDGLDSAARKLGLPLAHAPRLEEGTRLMLGRYGPPDVSLWAFEARVGQTSQVIEGAPAEYVFRLDSLIPGGVQPLQQVRATVLAAVRLEKKRVVVRQRAQELAARLPAHQSLQQGGASLGIPVQVLGPFVRLNPPGPLQGEPEVLGAGFGLGVGQRSNVIAGAYGTYIVESLWRKLADSSAWLAQRAAQRDQLLQPARQARLQAYIEGLRQMAKVVDRRKEIFRPQTTTAGS